MTKTRNKIDLKYLIIAVSALVFLLSVASSVFSSYQGNIRLLKEQSLETNRVYAQKLSQMASVHLSNALKVLEYSVMEIAGSMDDEETLFKEVNRLQQQELTFNSVTIANAEGLILAGAPVEYGLKGETIKD